MMKSFNSSNVFVMTSFYFHLSLYLCSLQVLSDIAYHNIQIFQAPTYENEDEETIAEAEEIASKIPFAVVGSDHFVQTSDGRTVRGRAYPWGVVEVDNEEHCDFVKLRQMLVRTYMEELREYTNDVLYENWRTEKLLSMGVAQDSSVFKEIKYVFSLSTKSISHAILLLALPLDCRKSASCMRPNSPRWRLR
jgi:septin 7